MILKPLHLGSTLNEIQLIRAIVWVQIQGIPLEIMMIVNDVKIE